MTAEGRTPAQVYSLVFGVTLLLVGIAGFFVNSEFNTGSNIQGDDLIIFEVNGIHNIIHLLSGVLGIALSRTRSGGYAFALGFGLVYGLVTILGFIDGDTVLGLIPVNTEDNILHLLISGAGIAAAVASKDQRNDARARTA